MSKSLTVTWVDVESTGLDPRDSAAFEIAFLIYKGSELLGERVFYLNPLNDVIKFGEEAYKVHGVSEEVIRSYPPAEKVIPEIAEWLSQWSLNEMNDHVEVDNKFVFAGYCANFDYGHVKALFERCDISMDSFFSGRIIDVHERVKKVGAMGLLPRTENHKLETMTKALGIPHEDSHSALSDIKASRRLYETIYMIERRIRG